MNLYDEFCNQRKNRGSKREPVIRNTESPARAHQIARMQNYEVALPAVTLLERPDFSASSPVLSISIEPLK
jgi:hypothetical protein